MCLAPEIKQAGKGFMKTRHWHLGNGSERGYKYQAEASRRNAETAQLISFNTWEHLSRDA